MVATRAGLRPSALRYYESIGLLPVPQRVNGRRVYEETIFSRLALVQYARSAGFRLAEIKRLIDNSVVLSSLGLAWQQVAPKKLMEIDRQIDQLQARKQRVQEGLACTCSAPSDCVILQEGALGTAEELVDV